MSLRQTEKDGKLTSIALDALKRGTSKFRFFSFVLAFLSRFACFHLELFLSRYAKSKSGMFRFHDFMGKNLAYSGRMGNVAY